MTNLSLSQQITYCTVRLECTTKSGIVKTGTAFVCSFCDNDDMSVPVFITNRHVVADAVQGKFHLHRASPENIPLLGQHESYEVKENFENIWTPHPDQSVDLCAMTIAPILKDAQQKGKPIFFRKVNKTCIATKEELGDLSALEEIVMIGYPNGLWDAFNNMPIVRKGVTATHPSFDYEGKQEFMIDAACFPGSSGSPVFLFNQGGYATKNGFQIGSRLKLIGVMYAGPQYTTSGELQIVHVPTESKIVPITRIPNNLGCVIKSHRLLEFEEIFQSRLKIEPKQPSL